ncbi:MAG: FAD-dependent oxidoreductase [Candidatus Magnetomorum sp.]|nr:FAD-dependent oxidoreductase [Candidatus Magnetomorum sp.]
MTEAILFMLGLGVACGGILSLASRVFYVYEDPRIAAVEYCLSGANCGGCGYAGCSAAAAAVVAGKATPTVCIVGGPECAEAVAAVMGMEVGAAEPPTSQNCCTGGHRADDLYNYMGAISCHAVNALSGGYKTCDIGCLGFGDCVKSCQFDAIDIGSTGVPVVDYDKCVGCGACERACPKGIVSVSTPSERLLHFNQDSECLAPCRQGCPAEINIPKYIRQIKEGNYIGAIATIRERNPMLLSCGRVCPHPCETACRREIEDEAVSINQLKRFVADYEMNSGVRFPISQAPSTGKRIAIVGGGPAGLSCAYFLARLGHSPVIYESMNKLGGMLRYGIPEYRLPKKVLDWEIEGILNLGITAKTNMQLGKDFTIESLREEGFDAIFLGVGAWVDYALGVDGEDLKGCYKGIQFLSRLGDDDPLPIGKRVGVVGGGNSAIDCVRNAMRMGAEEVYIIYRRTRAEMPANEVEIEAAEHEGIKFIFLAAPVRVVADEKGQVTHMEYLKMELGEPDASGRRRPVPVEGSETLLPLDTIITAIGQQPDIGFLKNEKDAKDLAITRWKTFDVDAKTLQGNIPYIFSAGDAQTGPSLVVDAIGGGRRAARSIHLYVTEQDVTPAPNALLKAFIPGTKFKYVDGIKKIQRAEMEELPPKTRIQSFIEVDQVLKEDVALRETKRCLQCGNLCYNPDC